MKFSKQCKHAGVEKESSDSKVQALNFRALLTKLSSEISSEEENFKWNSIGRIQFMNGESPE